MFFDRAPAGTTDIRLHWYQSIPIGILCQLAVFDKLDWFDLCKVSMVSLFFRIEAIWVFPHVKKFAQCTHRHSRIWMNALWWSPSLLVLDGVWACLQSDSEPWLEKKMSATCAESAVFLCMQMYSCVGHPLWSQLLTAVILTVSCDPQYTM